MLHHFKNRQLPSCFLYVQVHTRCRQTLAKLRVDACVSAARPYILFRISHPPQKWQWSPPVGYCSRFEFHLTNVITATAGRPVPTTHIGRIIFLSWTTYCGRVRSKKKCNTQSGRGLNVGGGTKRAAALFITSRKGHAFT